MKIGFSAQEVCKIANITYPQINYWDKIGLVKPSIMGATGTGSRRIYSFADVIGVKVAVSLKEEGLSVQKIRKSVEYLKANFPDISKPLTNFVFISDGKSIFVLTDDPQKALDTLIDAGQFIFNLTIGKMITETKNKIISIEKAEEETGTVFEVVIEPDDGRFHAYCPILRGCHTWGHTEAEAFLYIEDAVKLYLKSLIEDGEPIPGIGHVKAITPIIRLKAKERKEEAA